MSVRQVQVVVCDGCHAHGADIVTIRVQHYDDDGACARLDLCHECVREVNAVVDNVNLTTRAKIRMLIPDVIRTAIAKVAP